MAESFDHYSLWELQRADRASKLLSGAGNDAISKALVQVTTVYTAVCATGILGLSVWAAIDWDENISGAGKTTDPSCSATTHLSVVLSQNWSSCPGFFGGTSSDSLLGTVCSGHGLCNVSNSSSRPSCVCDSGFQVGSSGSCDTPSERPEEPVAGSMLPLLVAALGFFVFCLVLSLMRLREALRIRSNADNIWVIDGNDMRPAALATHLRHKSTDRRDDFPSNLQIWRGDEIDAPGDRDRITEPNAIAVRYPPNDTKAVAAIHTPVRRADPSSRAARAPVLMVAAAAPGRVISLEMPPDPQIASIYGTAVSYSPRPAGRAHSRSADPMISKMFAANLARAQEHARTSFAQFDLDGNGYLEKDEVAQMVASLGLRASCGYIDGAWSVYDTDGDGRLGLDEVTRFFVVLLKSHAPARDTSRITAVIQSTQSHTANPLGLGQGNKTYIV